SVCRLTGIRPAMLKQAETFPEVYRAFKDWCGDEFSFITWSETDIPVLMDNLLMHGIPLDNIPVCYDLQRIFGCEILRNDSQCALESAMDMLRLPKAKAHDALNDVRNTVKIADFLDLPALIEHYETRYVNYGEDRLSDVFGHKPYPSTSEAIDDESIVTFTCPCCDERLKADAFVFSRSGKPIGTATCSNDTSYFIRIGGTRVDRQSIVISRRIFRMNDDLQDIYDEAAEDME
ncbi:MAG: hypothetical protein MJ099_06760, partial [Clostridia bacterium]|nr:hypothetical protein [Clostridia bacterium]